MDGARACVKAHVCIVHVRMCAYEHGCTRVREGEGEGEGEQEGEREGEGEGGREGDETATERKRDESELRDKERKR